jgi:superfamily II DNA or RNA helicase
MLTHQFYCVIYTYTTALRTPVGRVKVGSARRMAASAYDTAKIRIAEQSTAISSDDPAIILEVFDVSNICETGSKGVSLSNLRTLEQTILHKNMKHKGMWFAGDQEVDVKDSSEWFFADTVQGVVTEVKSQLNQKQHGVARPDSHKMREEQQECTDMAVHHYTNLGTQFLINAKMRFGKTFVSYQIAKSLQEHYNKNFKILVLTYKPAVESGWAEDLANHVDFDGWKYSYAKSFDRDNPVTLGDAKCEVLFASFQDLNDMSKIKWANINNYHFDIIIIDEQHYGIQTEKAQKTLASISYDRILEVSGTPLHALMSGKFLDNEIYSWTYADEQRKRQLEKDTAWATDIYRWLPMMQFMIFQISDDAKSQCSFYDDIEGFTMQKWFSSNDGETFIDEAAVTLWLEEAYGTKGHKNKSPVRQYNSDHMVWKLPSVASCTAMETLLNKLDYVKHKPLVVSGTKGADLRGVKQHIKRFDKTVTLTCGSLMTGTTVPEWDMIFMLDGGISAQDYFQTIFRVQSSNKAASKETCYVVDYNPQRNLQMIYDYAFVQSTVNNNSVQKNITEFLDFAPIMDHTGNKPVQKNIEDVLNAIAHTSNALEKFGSGFNVNFNNITQDVKDILNPVKQDANSKRNAAVNNNNIELGKNKTSASEKGTQKTVDTTAKEQRDLQQKAITVVKSIPNYLWLETQKVDNIDDILYTNNTQMFEREVGISIEGFKKLCKSQFVNTKRVNQCILSFQQNLKRF